MKKFIFGFLLGGLIFGAIGAAAVSYIATPVDFKVLVNGNEFVSDPPALVVEGRTYLPLRAIGEALGVPVNWNEELRQAEVGDRVDFAEAYEAEILTRASDIFYVENTNVPNVGVVAGLSAYKKTVKDEYITYFYLADNELFDGRYFLDIYKSALIKYGFTCKVEGNALTAINIERSSTVVAVENEGILIVGFKAK